jgi:hypothetical protein
MSVYGFRSGPTYRTATPMEMLDHAFDQPMSDPRTFMEQMKGGAIESFGLGTVIRDFAIPQGNQPRQITNDYGMPSFGPDAAARWLYEGARGIFNPVSSAPALTEEQYRASPYFRQDVPWDAGMTEERAAALADWNDAKKVRDYFGAKRPVSAFLGNLAGQALDPINYIPIAGPSVKAAAVARLGILKGSVAVGALDAAANTALFGIATSGARASYGDDVSWQALTSEIGTAALVGSAFGLLSGAIGRRADRRLRAIAEAKASEFSNTIAGRVGLNDAIAGLVEGGEVRLGPNAGDAISAVAREAEQLHFQETVIGRTITTPTGMSIQVRPEIVDASQLVRASGDLQPRDRTRSASDAQIEDIAINLDPRRLMYSPEADRGAPIVGPDGIVESGNGRVAALQRAADAYPERFAEYRQALRAQGYDVPEDGVPVLVSRRVSDMSADQRVDFVRGANTSTIARMSATETALVDAEAMTDAVLEAYAGGDIKAPANRQFVKGFLDNLSQNERSSLLDGAGGLNADGVRRIENSLVASAYGDPDVVARFAEATDDNARAITGAMADVAPDWARLRRGLESGDLDPQLDLTGNLLEALRILSRAREMAALEGRPVHQVIDEAVKQLDILNGAMDARTEAFVQAFYQGTGYRRAKSRDDVAAFLRSIVAEVEAAGRPQLFSDRPVTSADIMQTAGRSAVRQREMTNVGQGNGVDATRSASGGQGNRQQGFRQAGRSPQGTGRGAAGGRPDAPRVNADLSGRRADPPVRGLLQAEQALQQPEELHMVAAQYRVNIETGDFHEQAEIDQLAVEGRLDDAARTELEEAAKIFENGAAYGEALKTAVGCLI